MYDNKHYNRGYGRDYPQEKNADSYSGFSAIPYATAFVRPQVRAAMYPISDGFSRGTMFPELYSPYKR